MPWGWEEGSATNVGMKTGVQTPDPHDAAVVRRLQFYPQKAEARSPVQAG